MSRNGVSVSVITAVFITQLFVNLLAESEKLGTNSMFGVKEDGTPKFSWNFNIKFIENRKKCYALSLAVILIGVAAFAFKGFNYGIDFTGGNRGSTPTRSPTRRWHRERPQAGDEAAAAIHHGAARACRPQSERYASPVGTDARSCAGAGNCIPICSDCIDLANHSCQR